MPGLVPGIHVFLAKKQGVDGRDISAFTRVFRRAMPGHDVPAIQPNRKMLLGGAQAHFRRARIARPITQSLSLSERKLSSSVKWVTRWR